MEAAESLTPVLLNQAMGATCLGRQARSRRIFSFPCSAPAIVRVTRASLMASYLVPALLLCRPGLLTSAQSTQATSLVTVVQPPPTNTLTAGPSASSVADEQNITFALRAYDSQPALEGMGIEAQGGLFYIGGGMGPKFTCDPRPKLREESPAPQEEDSLSESGSDEETAAGSGPKDDVAAGEAEVPTDRGTSEGPDEGINNGKSERVGVGSSGRERQCIRDTYFVLGGDDGWGTLVLATARGGQKVYVNDTTGALSFLPASDVSTVTTTRETARTTFYNLPDSYPAYPPVDSPVANATFASFRRLSVSYSSDTDILLPPGKELPFWSFLACPLRQARAPYQVFVKRPNIRSPLAQGQGEKGGNGCIAFDGRLVLLDGGGEWAGSLVDEYL